MGSPETCPTEGWVLIGGADYGGPIPTDPWVVGPVRKTRREAIAAVYPDAKAWAKARRGSQSGIRVWCVHTTSQAYAGAVKPAPAPATPPAAADGIQHDMETRCPKCGQDYRLHGGDEVECVCPPAPSASAVTRAERDVLRNALACAAVPLEVLAATECDDNGKALAPTTKAAVLRAVEAIRAALRGKHPQEHSQGGHDTGNARGEE